MASRRNANRIRGPQSALTDFLAANNISAVEIRASYEQRRRESEQQLRESEPQIESEQQAESEQQRETEQVQENGNKNLSVIAEEEEDKEADKDFDLAEGSSRKRRKIQDKRVPKENKDKSVALRKSRNRYPNYDDSCGSDLEQFMLQSRTKKAPPPPGQFANCQNCDKRFTVTPYSKEGPDGGLLCTSCGKMLASKNVEKKSTKKSYTAKKRRKVESDRMDGIAPIGAKTLQQLCLETIAANAHDIEEFGDMPCFLMDRLSRIFSKKRVLNSRTVQFFLQPLVDNISFFDCAYLETDDYNKIFAFAPQIKKLALRNACQFKDQNIQYLIEKNSNLQHLQLYAANLVSNEMWLLLFEKCGHQLEAVQLQWLDASFEDDAVEAMVTRCPRLKRVKFKHCPRIGESSVNALGKAQNLQHISLEMSQQKLVPAKCLVELIRSVGPKLQTLSLQGFGAMDDEVLAEIGKQCKELEKLRLSENSTCTDAGFVRLFGDSGEWKNRPLRKVDLSGMRDVDNVRPDGPELPVGLASGGFKALMKHSGEALEQLDVVSCRHIDLDTFLEVFGEGRCYPNMKKINISFCKSVNSSVVLGIFRSCPKLKKLIAFACFNIGDIVVPAGIILIGVPKAQDGLERIGSSGLLDALSSTTITAP